MKIYANNDMPTTPLDEFAGKDVWVRIEPTINFSRDYLRILSLKKYDGGYVALRYNSIPIDTDLDLYHIDPSELYFCMTTVRSDLYCIDSIQRSKVKNVIPTADLLWGKNIPASGITHVLAQDDHRLDKFVGKNVWVIAEYLPSGKYMYVNFYEKFGNTVDYCALDEATVNRLIDQHDVYLADTAIFSALSGDSWCRKYSLINSWQLRYPIELLTNEELTEIAKEHPTIWEDQ